MQADHDAAQHERGVVDARPEGALAPEAVDGDIRGYVGVLVPTFDHVPVIAAVREERPVEQAQRPGRLARKLGKAGRGLGRSIRQQRRCPQPHERWYGERHELVRRTDALLFSGQPNARAGGQCEPVSEWHVVESQVGEMSELVHASAVGESRSAPLIVGAAKVWPPVATSVAHRRS